MSPRDIGHISGIERLITAGFFLVWFGIMLYWAKRSNEIQRWFAGGVLFFLVLLSFEVFRRKFGLGPKGDDSYWALFLNTGLFIFVILATLATVWVVRREYGRPSSRGGTRPPPER